jgi:iron complex transport system substrate-binding protein
LRRFGVLTRSEREAAHAADRLAAALDALRTRYAARPRIRVLYQIWNRPIYTISGSHVISDALMLCGAVNVFEDISAPAAPAVTLEAVVLRDPDLIIASGPPAVTAEWLAEWRRFPALAAVRHAQLVTYADERIDRMGPSVIEATGNLCAVIDGMRDR